MMPNGIASGAAQVHITKMSLMIAIDSNVVVEEHETLDKCARKAGRPLSDLQVLTPEADFPSPDGTPPLKMVLARVAEV